MVISLLILLTLFGLAIGSFLGVVISRLPQKKSIVYGRSYCDHCHQPLRWYDLVPLVSFIFLQGKCRYCHFPIGYETMAIELITAIAFVLTGLTTIPRNIYITDAWTLLLLSFQVLYSLYIISSFIAIGFIDMKHGIIPNAIVYPASALSLLYFTFFPHEILFSHLLSGAVAMLFFFLLFLLTRGRGMGLGDVKFTLLLGLFLGFPGIVTGLYIAFLTGALIALILIMKRKKKFYGSTIPFGPFLVIGGLVSFFWGNSLIHILLHVLV